MFFSYPQDFKERELAPGFVTRLVWGERIMLSQVTSQPNSIIPPHSHPHEQMGIVIEGELKLTIGNETRVCKRGDAFAIPSNVEHSAVSGNKLTVVLDAFSPPREDYK